MIGIYKITNLINNKVYVGQSIDIKERWNQHKYKANNPKELGYNSAIHQAFRKYGIENFNFEVIEQCEVNELDFKERYWIQELNSLVPNGYNILTGGQKNRVEPHFYYCTKCGVEITKNSKTGLCFDCYIKTQRKVERPEKETLYQELIDTEGAFSALGKKYRVADNTIRKWCKGYGLPFHSADYKQIKNVVKKPNKRPVAQLDKDTEEIIQCFESTAEAARSLNKKSHGHITEACQGKIKTCYGYKWRYI